jgi:hypothetical protein
MVPEIERIEKIMLHNIRDIYVGSAIPRPVLQRM